MSAAMRNVGWAEDAARALLPNPLPRRRAHATGRCHGADAGPVLGADTELVTDAAWLHDIGYAPGAGACRFSPAGRLPPARHRAGRRPALPAGRPSLMRSDRGRTTRPRCRAGQRVQAGPGRCPDLLLARGARVG